MRSRLATRELWSAVDGLIDRAPDLDELRAHRLTLLAARRWRHLGKQVPEEFVRAERLAQAVALTTPLLLGSIRQATDGPILVMKGPEVAARYPSPLLRPYGDVDLLVPDAAATQRALVSAGFREVGNPALYRDIHHLRPLHMPNSPLVVEIHHTPKWIGRRRAPGTGELLAAAQSSSLADGILTLQPAHHAVLLAVHAWAHEQPVVHLLSVIDVAAMAGAADLAEADAVALRWGVSRLWRTTIAIADALFADAPEPWALRLWARNLSATRDRTVLESHLQRWLSSFSALPPGAALAETLSTMSRDVRPEAGESWRTKTARSGLAVRNAFQSKSRHDEALVRRGYARRTPPADR